MDYGFQVLDSSLCQWDFGFLEPYFGFQSLAFWIPQGIFFFLIPHAGISGREGGGGGGFYFVFESLIILVRCYIFHLLFVIVKITHLLCYKMNKKLKC